MKKNYYYLIFTTLLFLPVVIIHAQKNNAANVLFPETLQQFEIPAEKGYLSIAAIEKQSTLIVAYDSTYRYQWDTITSKWGLPAEKELFTRDANKNIIKWEIKRPNAAAWDIVLRSTYTYDGNNNQLSEIREEIDNNNALLNMWKEIDTYDAKQNVTKRVFQKWNAGTSTWSSVTKDTCTYDAKNNRIDSIHQSWNGAAWVNYHRYGKSYDANNNLLFAVTQSWISNTWDSISLYAYTYDIKHNRTSEIYKFKQNGKWVNGHQRTYDYDADNNMIHRVLLGWEENAWKNAFQIFYSYGANHNVLNFKGQFWSAINNSWDPFHIYYSATYNADNTQESGVVFQYANLKKTYGDSTYYYYHKPNSTVINVDENVNAVHIYPNPSKGEFTIALAGKRSIADIAVYSINGQKIMQQQDVSSLNITSFPKGIYFIRINDGHETYTRKIVLQ